MQAMRILVATMATMIILFMDHNKDTNSNKNNENHTKRNVGSNTDNNSLPRQG